MENDQQILWKHSVLIITQMNASLTDLPFFKGGSQLGKGPGYVESDVGHWVLCQLQDHW